MKIKLIKGWNGRSAGEVLEPEMHEVSRLLIQRGLAVAVEEKAEKKRPKLQEWVKERDN